MRRWLNDLDRILRGEATRLAALREESIEVPLGGLLLVIFLLAMLYGVCMGFFAGFRVGGPFCMQWFASTVKVPSLFLLTLVVTFPSLYVFLSWMVIFGLVGTRWRGCSVPSSGIRENRSNGSVPGSRTSSRPCGSPSAVYSGDHIVSGLLVQIDDILRRRGPLLLHPTRSALLRLILCVVAFGTFYGAIMGGFGGIQGERLWQIFNSALKVPLLLLGTSLIAWPSFFVLNTLVGSAP